MSIIKVKSIHECTNFIDDKTLIGLDLDNTLIKVAGKYQFGSYQWGSYIIRKMMETGLSMLEALVKTNPLWDEVQKHIDLIPVEKDSSGWLRNLQEKGHTVLGLTGRTPQVAEITINQLLKNSFDFSFFNPLNPITFHLPQPVGFKDGIFFCGTHNCKGEVLSTIIRQLHSSFKRVLLVDDQIHYLERAKEVLSASNIEFLGFHFLHLEEEVSAFDPKLSQEEGREILNRLSVDFEIPSEG